MCLGVEMAEGSEERSDTQDSKYFTERRMDVEVAEETRAEEVKVEGA